MDEQIEQARWIARGKSVEDYHFSASASQPTALTAGQILRRVLHGCTVGLVLRIFDRSREKTFLHVLGVVGTCATLCFPERPKWVRVERFAPHGLLLSEGEPLVPDELPNREPIARQYLHRLVAAEAARREVDHIRRRAPKSKEWTRLANSYLVRFKAVRAPSADSREVLFESLVREVSLRFFVMVRRLRKARQRLFDEGRLTNRDLAELWTAYAFFDGEIAEGWDEEMIPEHLREPELQPRA